LLLTRAMNPRTRLFRNIYDLVLDVKQTLRDKGFIVPIKHKDGSVRLNQFTVSKQPNGVYSIVDSAYRVRYNDINLPQTAVLLANDLALGRYADAKILELDRQYGFYTFEQQQLKRVVEKCIKNKDWIRVDACSIKEVNAKEKAKNTKRLIVASFEKICRQR